MHRLRLLLIHLALILPFFVASQNPEKVIVNEEIDEYDNFSYLYVESVTLKPGFEFTATENSSLTIKNYPRSYNNPPSSDKNFVRTELIKVDGILNLQQVSELNETEKETTFAYVDGLGRESQTVIEKGSPLKKDIVKFVEYDQNGRMPFDYQSYVSNSSTGAFQSAAKTDQSNFYQTANGITHDSRPFTEFTFDNSPLNRVLSQYGAGEDWKNQDIKISFDHSVADAGEIKNWIIQNGLPKVSGTNSANEVFLETKTYEGGQVTKEYKDGRGLMLCRSVKADENTWLSTYYIYNLFGEVVFVIPPVLADINTPTADDVDELAFEYQYDKRRRVKAKKLPGADWVYFVYDKWGRQVLAQDGVQRSKSPKEWTFTKYDNHNRVAYQGILTSNDSHDELIADADENNSLARFESRTGSTYTISNSFPDFISSDEIIEINYYDDYTFLDNNWDVENLNYDFINETGFPSSYNNSVKGYATGSQTRILGTTKWLNSVVYYDNLYRTIQSHTEHNLGGTNVVSNNLSFSGISLSTLTRHNSIHESEVKILKEFVYLHNENLKEVYFTINDGERILYNENNYNELNQVVETNLMSYDNGNSFLQSVDMRYNIRGILTSINNSTLSNDGDMNDDNNDLFGEELIFNQETYNINGTSTNKMYDGNISAIKWSSNNLIDAPTEKILGYSYDKADRFSSSNYAVKDNTGWNKDAGLYNVSVGSYDKNGNINSLTREGLYNNTKTTIDNISYSYANGSNSNRLIKVEDAGNEAGFDNNAVSMNTEYYYDGNGNMIEDLNKGLTSIEYNHLNLPTTIDFEDGSQIKFTYSASGIKISKELINSTGQQEKVIHYTGIGQYETENSATKLKFLNTEGGRALKIGQDFEHERFLKDHLDNVRVSFGKLSDTDYFLATMETENSTREESDFNGINVTNRTTNQALNKTKSTAQIATPNEVVEVLANVGPAKSIQVKSGDFFELDVYGAFTNSNSNNDNTISNIAALLAGTFGIANSGETANLYQALNDNAPSASMMSFSNSSTPRAYLAYIILSDNYLQNQYGYAELKYSSLNKMEKLHLELEVPFDGEIYIYLSNESSSASAVAYFDEFSIKHIKNTSSLVVTQATDYYPFGLKMEGLSYSDDGHDQNKYLFQGQEHQDDYGLNWDTYKYRNSDPALGRFFNLDPIAEDYDYNSVYSFSENHVVAHIELEGAEKLPFAVHVGNAQASAPLQPGASLLGVFTYAYDYFFNGFEKINQGVNLKHDSNRRYQQYLDHQDEHPAPPQVMKLHHQMEQVEATKTKIEGVNQILETNYYVMDFSLGGIYGTFGSQMAVRGTVFGTKSLVQNLPKSGNAVKWVDETLEAAAGTGNEIQNRSINFLKGTKNCANCAIAGDATLKGFPSSALNSGVTKVREVAEYFGLKVWNWGQNNTIDTITEKLLSKGDGATAVVFGFRGVGVDGHYFNVVNKNGIIEFLDFQRAGTAVMKEADFSSYTDLWLLHTTGL